MTRNSRGLRQRLSLALLGYILLLSLAIVGTAIG